MDSQAAQELTPFIHNSKHKRCYSYFASFVVESFFQTFLYRITGSILIVSRAKHQATKVQFKYHAQASTVNIPRFVPPQLRCLSSQHPHPHLLRFLSQVCLSLGGYFSWQKSMTRLGWRLATIFKNVHKYYNLGNFSYSFKIGKCTSVLLAKSSSQC